MAKLPYQIREERDERLYAFCLKLAIVNLICAIYWRLVFGNFEVGWGQLEVEPGAIPPSPWRNRTGVLIVLIAFLMAVTSLIRWIRRKRWRLTLLISVVTIAIILSGGCYTV